MRPMRFVAPLLVLAVLVGVALRFASRPSLAYERERIEAFLDLAANDVDRRRDLDERIGHWLEAHGDDHEARWFAARAWLKLGAVAKAVDTVWAAPALAEAPGTARRFGALVLRTAGFDDDENLRQPTPIASTAALLLAEGEDAPARAWLERFIRDRLEGAFLTALYGTLLYSTEDTRLWVAELLRQREDEAARVLAALAAMRAAPYEGRDQDYATLVGVVQSGLRWQERFVWSSTCTALGRMEDVQAFAVLEDLRLRLLDLGGENDEADAATCAAGLLAGGRWDALPLLLPYQGARGERTQVRIWFGDALVHRLLAGDAEAPDALAAFWDTTVRVRDPRLRARLATALFLKDALPSASPTLETVLGTLEADGAKPAEKSVAAAFRYRRGDPGSREVLLERLRQDAAAGWLGSDPGAKDQILVSSVLTLARALYLYER